MRHVIEGRAVRAEGSASLARNTEPSRIVVSSRHAGRARRPLAGVVTGRPTCAPTATVAVASISAVARTGVRHGVPGRAAEGKCGPPADAGFRPAWGLAVSAGPWL